MNQIRSLFDSGKDINRVIEKVITYQASQEQRLKGEISEYIVTESIEQQLEQLLEKMLAAMEAGSGHEIGVSRFSSLLRLRQELLYKILRSGTRRANRGRR